MYLAALLGQSDGAGAAHVGVVGCRCSGGKPLTRAGFLEMVEKHAPPAPKERKKLCFVVGPIGEEDSDVRIHSDWLLEEIIEPVMAEHRDFTVQRADKIAAPGLIDAQVIEALLSADLVIADITTLNPNAFYEIGIRHMHQRPIIHMHEAGEKIPFDISIYRSIKFSRKRPSDIRAARRDLSEAVKAVLEDDYQVENPVTKVRGRIKLEEHATPEVKVLLDDVAALRSRVANLEERGEPLNFSTASLSSSSMLVELASDADPEEVARDIWNTAMHAGMAVSVIQKSPDHLELKWHDRVSAKEKDLLSRRIFSMPHVVNFRYIAE
jgi:hypothetical protein